MKTISKIKLLYLLLLFIVSCSSVSVTSDYDRSVDFTNYKTFSFYHLKVTDSQSVNQLSQNRIISNIKTNLINKGFKETTSKPDLLVNATTITKEREQYNAYTNYYATGGLLRPYGWGGGYYGYGGLYGGEYYGGGAISGVANTTVTVQEYSEGSLVIDVIQASNNMLIWTGTGKKQIDSPSKNPDEDIFDAVTKIMAGFPPNSTKK